MPKYDNYPVEGYVGDEPGGRPRSGNRYRSAGGDRKVLIFGIALVALVSLAVVAFAWTERANTLTEYAFGDDRHECGVEAGAVTLQFRMDVDEVADKQSAALEAPGFQLDVSVKTLRDQDEVAKVTRFFDTTGFAWDTDRAIFDVVVEGVAKQAADPIGICDVELTPLAPGSSIGPDAIVPRACNDSETTCYK